MADPTSFGFPFSVSDSGRITATGGDEAIRAKIIQVLFTAPGERVNKPTFGCGLFKLVFGPNDFVMAAAMEFTVGQQLTQWLEDDLSVDSVSVESQEETAVIQIVYTRKQDLARQAVRIQFA